MIADRLHPAGTVLELRLCIRHRKLYAAALPPVNDIAEPVHLALWSIDDIDRGITRLVLRIEDIVLENDIFWSGVLAVAAAVVHDYSVSAVLEDIALYEGVLHCPVAAEFGIGLARRCSRLCGPRRLCGHRRPRPCRRK